ncbi:acyl carrier protein [Lichenibacterium minor]|jgi:acyl carrier protein|uniref:Acyl carrier protein n=1 Tax=Lichenibacterium minor TaxID=2316528 RepID=A0A4Q2U6X8_9HYPH|nr:phosphopantetheine-binding protein [Lichenibacterium minor]RYC31638.1 acyl carrier protein [Lichenibacterium minor]
MLDHVKSSPARRIGNLVEDILSRRGVDGPVAPDAELARFGMTSIDMVEVMLGVEAEFDVAIPPVEITMDNFRSVAAMVRLVSRLSPAA